MNKSAQILTLVVALTTVTALASESVRDGYKRPTFAMPYAWSKPKLDGVVDAKEWQQALTITALQTTAGLLSTRQSTFRLCWDEEQIYVAMQSPLRPGERIIQGLRRREPEKNVVFDDSYEVWLDVGTHTDDGQVCFFQFLGNYAGARYDVLHLPAVGNSRVNWQSEWEPVNRLTGDNIWEWEMAIPRATVFREQPLADGMAITMLLARNFKRPWEQNSVEGTGSFSALDTHSRYILSKTAPAIHIHNVVDMAKQTSTLQVGAWSPSKTDVKWQLLDDSKAARNGTLSLPGNTLVDTEQQTAINKPGDGAFRLRATSPDGGAVYADWSVKRQFGRQVKPKLDDQSDVIRLSLELNPVADYLRVNGDFIGYDNRAQFHDFLVTVRDAANESIASRRFKMDELAYVSGKLDLPGLQPGNYTATLDCLSESGDVVLSREQRFVKKDHAQAFPWWQTKRGSIDRVIAPWTAVNTTRGSVSMWGRSMDIGAAGLPAQVRSQGRDLLAAPIQLELETADGQQVTAGKKKAKVLSSADHRGELMAKSKLGEIAVTSNITAEFDGMYRVALTLTPKTPTAVNSLRMVVPFAAHQVDYFHSAGRGIRYGFDFGHIPDGKGRVWDCRRVSGNPMKVGSFVPYVMLTGPEAGLCWFADSDEGWVPNNDVPAFEIRRDTDGQIDLAFNFISSPVTLTEPRTITFAFQATPIKKMHDGWRMDGWWCGDTFMDFQILGKNGGHQIWTNVPFTLDEDACRKLVAARHKAKNTYNFGVDLPAFAVPYLEWKVISSRFAPEVAYFGDQWRTNVSDGLAFEDTLSDFIVYHMWNWAKTCDIDGIYIDNNRPQACANIDAGRGYRLPDGQIQPTYNLFAVRKLFLRMRAAFLEATGRSKFVLHTTNNFIAPWLGAADIAYDGEHHVIYPEMNKDFMDFWTPDRLRLSFPRQLGTAVNFMSEFQGRWEQGRLASAFRSYTGGCILYDTLPSGNANGRNTPAWIARDRFGIADEGVTFVGPWVQDSGLHCQDSDIHLAAWQRPDGKLLLAVVNYGDATTAEIEIDGEKLGLGAAAGWTIEDAEAGTELKMYDPKAKDRKVHWKASDEGPIALQPNGLLSVPVKRHDYRQIIISRTQLAAQ